MGLGKKGGSTNADRAATAVSPPDKHKKSPHISRTSQVLDARTPEDDELLTDRELEDRRSPLRAASTSRSDAPSAGAANLTPNEFAGEKITTSAPEHLDPGGLPSHGAHGDPAVPRAVDGTTDDEEPRAPTVTTTTSAPTAAHTTTAAHAPGVAATRASTADALPGPATPGPAAAAAHEAMAHARAASVRSCTRM